MRLDFFSNPLYGHVIGVREQAANGNLWLSLLMSYLVFSAQQERTSYGISNGVVLKFKVLYAMTKKENQDDMGMVCNRQQQQ